MNSITEITRRNIFDGIRLMNIDWCGRLDDVAFLSRLFDLKSMPSTDHRYKTADRDIAQHRLYNHDWASDWIFDDSRFNLLRCADDIFLNFLCEMVHPLVQDNSEQILRLLKLFNEYLQLDGWEIAARGEVSGKVIYAARKLISATNFALDQVKSIAQPIGAEYLHQQITRMESAVHKDSELAIGTAKEFLETICKTILLKTGNISSNEDLPSLIKSAIGKIDFDFGNSPDAQRAKSALRRLLGNLSGVGSAVGEVRNILGSGHGKAATMRTVDPIYARLVVGAAIALGVFLFEAFEAKENAE